MGKFFKFLLRTIVVLFILLNVIVVFHAYKFTHVYPQHSPKVIPQEQKTGSDKIQEIFFGINSAKQVNTLPDTSFTNVTLVTKNGLHLKGWMLKVPNARGTVAMFHGHGSKKSAILPEAYAFNAMGYNTFLLDFRAHGDSEGDVTTIGYDEAEDVKLAYDYLQKTGEQKIFLYGISLGAATITKAVNDFNLKPFKVILEMPFGTLPDAVVGRVKMMHLPPQPVSALLTFWGGTLHGFWAFNMRPVDYVKSIQCPVLLQWGKLDPRVTFDEEKEIYQNIKTSKQFVVYADCGHESLLKKEPLKWTTTVNDFLSAP